MQPSVRLKYFLTACFFCVIAAPLLGSELGDEKPNILWITSEDNASHWMGCYGNDQAKTPNIDGLAKNGVTFKRAYSNAPVCAVARCTLLHGVYSVTLGTQHMRSRYPIPDSIRPYVSYLRENGYYCTNNSKTDYNRAGDDKSIWDASGKKAHYRNRKEGQPFFAVFNLTVCHESSLFPERVAKNRERGVIPKQTRIAPKDIALPPYLPDLPEIRSDFAIYHDNITAMDKQVGELLTELEQVGLTDNTIVFYYSDHGGPTPRGKRYLTDTGVRIPLVVHVPERWKALSPFTPGTSTNEPVAFVDFAPTLLSMIGLEKPSYMQGNAFLGSKRVKREDEFVFLFGDRFDELVGMRRAVTDGKFKYIKRFMPHLPAAPYSYFQFSMPSWIAWRDAWQKGKLPPKYNLIWEQPQRYEELYDLANDPWETHNLAAEPTQKATLAKYRTVLSSKMKRYRDSGLIPESMLPELVGKGTYDSLRKESFAYTELLKATGIATSESSSLADLRELLKSKNELMQYWGTVGATAKGKSGKELKSDLQTLSQHNNATLRIAAAIALDRCDERALAIDAVLQELGRKLTANESVYLCNAILQIDCVEKIPKTWLNDALKGENKYQKRLARLLLDAQK